MSSFGNFVQCQVSGPVTIGATAIELLPVVAPYTLPPVGGGLVVLVDSPANPSFIEVVRYTSRSEQQLQGVTRGQEGTVARAWSGTIFAFQSLMAGDFQDKLDAKQASNTNLTALSGLTGVADRLPYFTGAGALALATLTTQARALLDDTTQLGMQSTLGLVKQTNVTDSTADALLINGAYGLGILGTAPVISNLDSTDTPAGFFRWANGGTGLKPAGSGSNGFVLVERYTSTLLKQTWTNVVGGGVSVPKMWVRTSSAANTWNTWEELLLRANVQTSYSDTTAGALLTVGAFGLGIPTVALNPDTLTTTGLFRAIAGTGTLPTGFANGTIINLMRNLSPVRISQIAQDDILGRLWVRGTGGDTVFGAWREVYTAGTILGTVSQSGGVPTGAIIERGSNANGEYTRWADGTQELWLRDRLITLVANSDVGHQWVLPASFIATGSAVATIHLASPAATNAFSILKLQGTVSSTTTADFLVKSDVSQDVVFSLRAVGRWYQ